MVLGNYDTGFCRGDYLSYLGSHCQPVCGHFDHRDSSRTGISWCLRSSRLLHHQARLGKTKVSLLYLARFYHQPRLLTNSSECVIKEPFYPGLNNASKHASKTNLKGGPVWGGAGQG